MPEEVLIQSQWEKHGTCHYQTGTNYYTTTENLYQSLNIPKIQSLKNITATNVKNAFLTTHPKLFSSAIKVSMNDKNRLKEIVLCYDFNNQFVSCDS